MKSLAYRLYVLVVFVWSAAALPAWAQAPAAYPGRTVTITVPFPAGGATDILTRGIAQRLTEKWGQSVVVDNKPGGASLIGAEAVARSAPDGYQLMLTISTLIQAPHLRSQNTFNPVQAFSPITEVARTPLIMVVHPDVKASTPAELVTLVKSQPGKFSYGTYGTGSSAHLYGFIFNKQTGLDMEHVAYKGEAPSVNDLIGGQIPIVIMSGVGAVPNLKAGKMKALAVTGPSRAPIFPGVPSFKELGYTGMDDAGWFGLFAPAGTPKSVVDKISTDVRAVLTESALKERMAALGLELTGSSPEDFQLTVAADYKKWSEVVKESGISAN